MTSIVEMVNEMQGLIDQSLSFEDRARSIQDESQPVETREAEGVRLRRDYSSWYIGAMAVLPPDMQAEFRKEYEGGPLALKIKKFLFEPLLQSPFFDGQNPLFPRYAFQVASTFLQPLEAQRQILGLVLQQLSVVNPVLDDIQNLAVVLSRFNVFRSAFNSVSDAWDVPVGNESELQRALLPSLKLVYDDVRPEDFVPDFAGGRSRSDFFLPASGIALETKMTRPSLSASKLRDELIIDFRQYASLGRVKGVVAFVYDPDRRLANPAALDDLTNLDLEKPMFVLTLTGR